GGEVTRCRSDRREPGHRKARRPKSILDRESQRPESDSSSLNRSQHVETYTSKFCVSGSWFWALSSRFFIRLTGDPIQTSESTRPHNLSEPRTRTQNQEPRTKNPTSVSS